MGGMCCTIRMGTGKSAGSRVKISARALGPPVEAPMASTRTVPVTMGTFAGAGPAEAAPAGVVCCRRGAQRALIFGISCSRMTCSELSGPPHRLAW